MTPGSMRRASAAEKAARSGRPAAAARRVFTLFRHFVAARRYLARPIPLQEFRDYDEYWEKRVSGAPREFKTRFAIGAEHIRRGSWIVDVGCGEGVFLEYLRERDPTVRALGIDYSQRAVDLCLSRGLEAVRCDLLAGERPEGRFDAVIAFEVLEHIPDAEEFLLALAALCADDGFILISVPNTGYILHRLRLLFGRFPVTSCYCHIKEHVRFWTVRDFREWADALGFEVLSVQGQQGPGGVGGNPVWLDRRFPALWAPQVIYKLRRA